MSESDFGSFRGRPRAIGKVGGLVAGPTFICVGSIHGNEPAGVEALERVFTEIELRRPVLHGEFVGFIGNVAALARRVRFIDHDLNRIWLPARIEALHNGGPPQRHSCEETELLELSLGIERAIASAEHTVYFLDIHTTSGDSPPFVTIGDTLYNRAFALHYPASTLLGLEEQLDGTLLEYLSRRGLITMGFEGGRHDDPRSVDHAEAAIWIGLAASGVLASPEDVTAVQRAYSTLAEARGRYPRVLEVRYRHAVKPDDGFRMHEGYSSFQTIRKGEPLAIDSTGTIHSPDSGRILMPRYQAQGDDGFFVMREFPRFWLAVSALLRRIRADQLMRLLPGIRRDPDQPDTLVIDRHVAKWYALEIFHLLGYRKRRVRGDVLVMSRR